MTSVKVSDADHDQYVNTHAHKETLEDEDEYEAKAGRTAMCRIRLRR